MTWQGRYPFREPNTDTQVVQHAAAQQQPGQCSRRDEELFRRRRVREECERAQGLAVLQNRVEEVRRGFAGREAAAQTPRRGPVEGFGLGDDGELTQARQRADEGREEGLRGLDYETAQTRQRQRGERGEEPFNVDAVLDGELAQQREVDRAHEDLCARGREEAPREREALKSIQVQQLVGGVLGGVGQRRDFFPRRAAEEEVLVRVLRPRTAGAAQREQSQRLCRRLQDLADDVVVGGGRGVCGGRAECGEAPVGERGEAALEHERERPQRADAQQRCVGVGEELLQTKMAKTRLRGQRATDARGAHDSGGGSGGGLPAVGASKQASPAGEGGAGGRRRFSHERLQPTHVLDRGLDQLAGATHDGAQVPLVEAEVPDKLAAAGELAVRLRTGRRAAACGRKVALLGRSEQRGERGGEGLARVARPVRHDDAAIEEADGGAVEAARDQTERIEVGGVRQLGGQRGGGGARRRGGA